MTEPVLGWLFLVVERLLRRGIKAAGCFFLSRHGEVADAFHVTDNACHIVNVVAMAFGAGFQVTFVDVPAVVANGVGDVKGKIVASFFGRNAKQLSILGFGEMFFQVGMERRTTGEMLDVFPSVKAELVNEVERFVFHDVKVTIVAIARNFVAIFAIPFGVFDSHIFGRNHFAVEEHLFRTIFFVVLFNQT